MDRGQLYQFFYFLFDFPPILSQVYRSTSPKEQTSQYFRFTQVGKCQKLTKHQIHCSNNRHRISQQVALGDRVEATQVSKARGTNVHTVRPLASITDNVHAHLALWCLDGGVCVAWWDGVSLGVQQEVVDEGLHVLLHGGTRGRGDLVVLNLDGTRGHLVEALVDDAEGLAELLHSAEVSVVAVAINTDWHVELDLVIGVIGRRLADVPWNTGSSEHDTREREVESIGGGDDTDATETVDPNTVVRQHLFGFVDTVAELGGPLVDVIEETDGDILGNTTRSDVRGVETGARDTLIEFLVLEDGWLACVLI